MASYCFAQALSSKLLPSAHYQSKPGDSVRVFGERSRTWEGLYSVHSLIGKEAWICDSRGEAKQFSIDQLLPVCQGRNDKDLLNTLRYIPPCSCSEGVEPTSFLMKLLPPFDPRCNTRPFLAAIQAKMDGLHERQVFTIFEPDGVCPHANVMKGISFFNHASARVDRISQRQHN